MFKKHVIGFSAAVLLITVLFSGCIQDEEISVYPGSQEIDIDPMFISESLNISEDKIDDAISDLNIKAYGINGVSKNTILAWYEDQHLEWTLRKSMYTNIFSLRAWSHWFAGRVVLVSDYGSQPDATYYRSVVTDVMQDLAGYDTVFLTSHAPLTTYAEYLNYLE